MKIYLATGNKNKKRENFIIENINDDYSKILGIEVDKYFSFESLIDKKKFKSKLQKIRQQNLVHLLRKLKPKSILHELVE